MLPAYGRELLQLRRDGKRPVKPVYVVSGWELAEEVRRRDRFALMAQLPRDANFRIVDHRRFDFSMLRDLTAVLIPDWVDWWVEISPQVASVRPHAMIRALSFHPDMETAAQKIERTVSRAERENVAA